MVRCFVEGVRTVMAPSLLRAVALEVLGSMVIRVHAFFFYDTVGGGNLEENSKFKSQLSRKRFLGIWIPGNG